jgi:DNA-binding transcriptional LysR family regulator
MPPVHTFSFHVPRLLHFFEIVERRSINKAARSLNISQPALSRSIRTLEQALGVPLLDRSARGVVPTAYGELLLVHARTIQANLGQTLTDVQALAGRRLGKVAIGATPAVSMLVTGAIQRFQAEHPGLLVRGIESASADLIAQVRTGELDLFVGPSSDVPEPDMIEEPLFVEQFGLWVRASHPLLRRRGLQLADLADEAWIVPQEERSLRRRLDAELRKAKVSISGPVIETSSLLLVKTLLTRGDRIALLAPTVLTMERETAAVKALKGRWSFPSRSSSIYFRQHGSRTPALRGLVRALKSAAAPAADKLAAHRRRRDVAP